MPFFARFADLLVAAAEPQPGWHVVDVGSGRGAVTFRLAEAVAPGGTVTAVDLSAAMVEALRTDLDAAGLPDVRALVGDVEQLDLPTASADAVTGSMVLFFLPDLQAGLHEIRRVLRPGGLLAFTVFGPWDPTWTRCTPRSRPATPARRRAGHQPPPRPGGRGRRRRAAARPPGRDRPAREVVAVDVVLATSPGAPAAERDGGHG